MFLFRSDYERIMKSKKIASAFIESNYPNHVIEEVPRDGHCILHAFLANLKNTGIEVSFDDIVSRLRDELKNNVYHYILNDLDEKLEKYIHNPLSSYDNDFADILLEALGMAYKVNMCYFQSNSEKCEVFTVFNPKNEFKDTFHFLRTESLHFDAVLRANFGDILLEGENEISPGYIDECYDEENDNIGNDTVISVSDDDSDEEGNTQVKQELDIDYENPTSEFLLNIILYDSSKYEVEHPLTCIRSNTLYTIKNKSVDQITCDNNGAYNNSRSNSKDFYVDIEDNQVKECKMVHKEGNLLYYNRRCSSRSYEKVYIDREKVYCIKRYYKHNKSVPGLRLMIVKLFVNSIEHPITCVVYHKSTDDISQDIVLLPHGNSKVSQQPYIKTDKRVLTSIDEKLDTCNDNQIFHSVLGEFGGPFHSISPSTEPRNQKQVSNRRAQKRRLETPTPSKLLNSPCGDLEKLIRLQRDPKSPVQTVLISGDWFLAFIYTERQLTDIVKFCCNLDDVSSSVLGVDTTFNLCDMWLTDTSYRNQRLKTVRSNRKRSPVFMGPAMLHHSKDENTFRRFCCELIAAKPELSNIKVIGVDMEAAIYNGFKSVIENLMRLLCVRHIQIRDEEAIDKFLAKLKKSDNQKGLVKNEIISDIYGRRISVEEYETGLAESIDENDFVAKLASLENKWENLCPQFHRWFTNNRKEDFVSSVVKSARENLLVAGLYYQNDIESIHAKQKRCQIKKGDIYTAVLTLSKILEMEADEEVLALYGKGNFVLSPEYGRFFTKNWHSMSSQNRMTHVESFRKAVPGISFRRPLNAGRKPNESPRARHTQEPTILIDRLPVSPTLVDIGSNLSSTAPPSVSSSSLLNIEDPRTEQPQIFTLHLKSLLSKNLKRCRGDCSEPISSKDIFVVKSYGQSTWTDRKTGQVNNSYGSLYCHFRDRCLKKFDKQKVYLDFEQFDYSKIELCPTTKAKITDADIAKLIDFGVSL